MTQQWIKGCMGSDAWLLTIFIRAETNMQNQELLNAMFRSGVWRLMFPRNSRGAHVPKAVADIRRTAQRRRKALHIPLTMVQQTVDYFYGEISIGTPSKV
ncbi:unnamed protein product [Mortierella alpina]